MKEIRLTLNRKETENFEIIKTWYNEKTDTGVIRNLIRDKFQEIKKLNFLGKKANLVNSEDSSICELN